MIEYVVCSYEDEPPYLRETIKLMEDLGGSPPPFGSGDSSDSNNPNFPPINQKGLN
jgi:hypothetical protein